MDVNENKSFSSKLNRLFEKNKKPDGTRYSQKDVLDSAPGVLTRVYLWRLRKGKVSRPSYDVVKTLADFFGVNPSYFFVDGEMSTSDNQQINDQQDDLIQQIALRSAGLDDDGKKAILMMIEAITKSQK